MARISEINTIDGYPRRIKQKKEMCLCWESPTQISSIVHSPGKIKLLMHCHGILAFPALSQPFQPGICLYNIRGLFWLYTQGRIPYKPRPEKEILIK